MLSDIFSLITFSFSAVSSWLSSILDSTGSGSIFLASIFVFILCRTLLRPIFGSVGSDRVSKFKSNQSSGEDS